MLNTTLDIYRAFLDGIKKPSTSVVIPSLFNRIIDRAQDEWLMENVVKPELNQKQIDDLQVLRVVTDGELTVDGVVLYPIAPNALQGRSFDLPYDSDVDINNDQGVTQNYPEYLRELNVQFKIVYVNNICGNTGTSDWLDARIMRTDQRTKIKDNPYREPRDERLYYEIVNDFIRLITDTDSYGHSLRLEYFRYPVTIFYNSTNPADTGDPTTGSVNCELPKYARREIVNIAIRTYLEEIKDPRYQSFLNEEVIRNQSK